MTYAVSGGALNSTQSNPISPSQQLWSYLNYTFAPFQRYCSFFARDPTLIPPSGDVLVGPDLPFWGQREHTLSYSVVKLFSKYSNLCDHVTDRPTDGRLTAASLS